MYCFPSIMNVIGGLVTSPTCVCHTGVPVTASQATRLPPESPPKTSLPAVVSSPPPPPPYWPAAPPDTYGRRQATLPVVGSIAVRKLPVLPTKTSSLPASPIEPRGSG